MRIGFFTRFEYQPVSVVESNANHGHAKRQRIQSVFEVPIGLEVLAAAKAFWGNASRMRCKIFCAFEKSFDFNASSASSIIRSTEITIDVSILSFFPELLTAFFCLYFTTA